MLLESQDATLPASSLLSALRRLIPIQEDADLRDLQETHTPSPFPV